MIERFSNDSGDGNTAVDTSNLSGNQLLSSAVLEKNIRVERWLLGKGKILPQKRLFKKQNSERKTIPNMWTSEFIQTFHFQLVLNGPYLTQYWRLTSI